MERLNSGIESEACPKEVLRLLGDYWTLRIVDSLHSGELRYRELQRTIGDVNSVTLTKRLKNLEDRGVVLRREETVDKQSVTYRLTEKGVALMPILSAAKRFAEEFPTGTDD